MACIRGSADYRDCTRSGPPPWVASWPDIADQSAMSTAAWWPKPIPRYGRRLHQREIIRAMATHEAASGIREIKVCIVPTATAVGPVSSPERPASPVPTWVADSIVRTANNINDPELKKALLRLSQTTAVAARKK